MSETGADKVILSTTREGVARITLNRANVHNAFDDRLIAELTAELERVGSDPAVRIVVLTGEGGTFSAGADLNWMRGMVAASEADNRADSLRLARLMRTLNFLPKPTIARVNGSAYGGGIGLIACCDMAIGVIDGKFSLSEVKLGLVPAVISPYVIAAIGARQARRFFIGGEVFDASEATRVGLLHQSVESAELDSAVDRAVHWFGKGGPVAQREAKQLALRVGGMTVESAERVDVQNAELIARLRVSIEGQQGLAAFLDRQSPPWVS
ncbi:MAG: enoyl-CoA hydratase-related protein [Dokdonella sp.]